MARPVIYLVAKVVLGTGHFLAHMALLLLMTTLFDTLVDRPYKNFLRMSFEPDCLTIYPIALDNVPRRRGWRAPDENEKLPDHNPRIVFKKPLPPRLMERRIVVERKAPGPLSG